MFDSTRRKFLVGTLAGLFTAPAIVRAASIMPVHNWQKDLLQVTGIDYETCDSLTYEYWAIGSMGLAKYTAKEIMDAPKGVFIPWLPAEPDRFRPVYENKTGLMFVKNGDQAEAMIKNIADDLDRDPVIEKLREEQNSLLRTLRQSRAEAEEERRRALRKVHLS